MRTHEQVVIVIGEEGLPEAPLEPTRPAPRWISRSLGISATVLVHLLLTAPLVLGVAAHKTRTPEGVGSVAWASQGEQEERMILLDLSAMSASQPDTPLPRIAAEGIRPDEFRIELVSSEPQPPAELKPEDFEEAGTANQAAGDPAGNAALFGRYVGQVTARIERAWMRPRSAIEGGRFECRVRIAQDKRGNVESIELQSCGNDAAWRNSLTGAILRASPLSAPPEPWLYTPTLTLNFSGEQYVAQQTPEYDYEPVITRVAMAAAPPQLFRDLDDVKAAQPAALDGKGDVELTITGSEVRWNKKGSSVATPR
jgi:hypothetical protein